MKLRVLAVLCAALLVAPAAFAELSATMDVAGDVETNTNFTIADDGSDNTLTWGNDGRTHIKFSGRVDGDNGWYGYAEGDAMIDTDNSDGIGVDNAFVKFGTESFALLIGRYEATTLFGKGQDTYIVGAPGVSVDVDADGEADFAFGTDRYQTDTLRGRNDFNNIDLFFGGLEIGVGIATQGDMNLYGARPVYTLSTDTMTLHVGGEFISYTPTNSDASDASQTDIGVGANVEVSVGGTLGASVAYGLTTADDDAGNSLPDYSIISTFLYYKMPVGDNTLGLGGGFTAGTTEDVVDATMFEGYVSFKQQLPVEGLYMSYAASFASASFDLDGSLGLADPDDTSAFGGRVRVNYAF